MNGAPRVSIPARIYAALLAAIGLVLLAGGGWLVTLGGSPYYALAGLAVGGSAMLLWRGQREGAWLYSAMLVGTTGWAVWESGFDGWALAARLVAPFVLGLWLVTPWSLGGTRQRGTSRLEVLRPLGTPAGFAVAIVGAIAIGGLLHLARPVSIDPAFEAAPAEPVAVGALRGDVELRDVGFSYAGAETPALSEVTLRVPAAQPRHRHRIGLHQAAVQQF